MRNILMRTVALAALAATPVAPALAQGGGANAPDAGPRAGGGHEGMRGGGMRGEGMGERQGGRADADGPRGDRGDAHGMRRDADRGERHDADRGDRRDADRGDMRRDRRDADRDDVRGRRDAADRDGRVDRREVDRVDRREIDRRDGDVERRGERVGERGMRRGPVRAVTTEQRSRIRSAIRGRGGEGLRGVDFDVRVGAAVPQRYRFRPLPPDIVSFVPEYEGYDYIVVDDQILILDPDTREVVAIIS